MEIERTIEFLMGQQASFASFASSFKTGMDELRQSQQATERLINAFAKN